MNSSTLDTPMNIHYENGKGGVQSRQRDQQTHRQTF